MKMPRIVYVLLKSCINADDGRGATAYQIAAYSGYHIHNWYHYRVAMQNHGLVRRVHMGRHSVTEKGKIAVALTDGMQRRALAQGRRFKFAPYVDWFEVKSK
jgi:hypothetical protein